MKQNPKKILSHKESSGFFFLQCYQKLECILLEVKEISSNQKFQKAVKSFLSTNARDTLLIYLCDMLIIVITFKL